MVDDFRFKPGDVLKSINASVDVLYVVSIVKGRQYPAYRVGYYGAFPVHLKSFIEKYYKLHPEYRKT